MTPNNRTANGLLWQSSMVFATLMLCIGAAVAQTPPTPRTDASPFPSPTPPPPPKPRVSPSPAARPTTQASPAPTPKPTPTQKPTTQVSPAPTPKPTPKPTTQASPAPTPESSPEASPARPMSNQPGEEAEKPGYSSEEERIRQLVQDEVNRAVGSNASSLNLLLFGLTLFPVGAMLFGIWLLRRSMASMVANEVKEKLDRELRAQLPAEIIGTLEGQENPSNAAVAALPGQAAKADNTEHLNELISMAMATQKLINDTRLTLEESMKFQDAIQQPFEDVLGVYLKQASELFREGQFQESIALYDRALQANPELDLAWLERGMAFTNLQQYEDAIASFNKALQLNSNSPDPWYEKARCYALKNDPDLAADNLRQAINRDASKRETAKTDPDFQAIRGEDMVESLLSGL